MRSRDASSLDNSMYLFNSSSTRNKLLTACAQSPIGEGEKWQGDNNRASECRAPKRSSNPNPESEETFRERTASAEHERLLDELALRSGGNHEAAQGTKDQPRRLVFHSGEARRARPAQSTRPVYRPRPDPHRRQPATTGGYGTELIDLKRSLADAPVPTGRYDQAPRLTSSRKSEP